MEADFFVLRLYSEILNKNKCNCLVPCGYFKKHVCGRVEEFS